MQVSRLSHVLPLAAAALLTAPANAGPIHWVVTDVSPTAFMAAHPGVGVHAAALDNQGDVLEQTVIGRGFGVPVVDSFLYRDRKVVDFDTIGHDTAAVWGTGLNESGEVAGECDVAGVSTPAVFTYANGSMSILPPAAGSPTDILIDNAGTLAGTIPGPMAAEYVDGQWQALVGDGDLETIVSAISTNGVIAGSLGSDAAIWARGKWTDLGAFPGQYAGYALGVNSLQQAVGISLGDSTVPFYWDKNHGLSALPIPAGLTVESNAVAGINNLGVAAGTAYGSDGVHILGWYEGRVYDVTDQIENPTGYRITQITGIANDRLSACADAADLSGVVHPVIITLVVG